MYVPIYLQLDIVEKQIDLGFDREELNTYLSWMVGSVCNRWHHQSNDNSTSSAEEKREHDEATRGDDFEPAEEQNCRSVASRRNDVELSEVLSKSTTKHAPKEWASIDQSEEIRGKARWNSMRQTVFGVVEVGGPNTQDDHE